MSEAVVNYDGTVFKCTTITQFNEENSYGKLNCDTGLIEWKQTKLSECTMNLRPEKCKVCKIYPSCYGPCNNHILVGQNTCYVENMDLTKEEYYLYLYRTNFQKKEVFNKK